jgi:hypothetical protein
VVHESARQVKQTGEPADDEDDVECFNLLHDGCFFNILTLLSIPIASVCFVHILIIQDDKKQLINIQSDG